MKSLDASAPDQKTCDAGATPCLRISVIIPVLDEARCLGDRLAELSAIHGIHERIVVDGDSRDGTTEIARSFAGAQVIAAPRGRASQMNAGARLASGDVFLFLHADTSLPADAAHWIRRALADPAVVGGAFRTWTVTDSGSTWLSPLLHLADVRSRYSRLPYGDQAIFVRADAFWRLGGFPELPLMEDLELSRRLRRIGQVRTVPAVVRVSGRRFLSRPLYYTFLVNIFPSLYRMGVAPRLLASLYGDPR
ncbi:MAG: TIGR04283 family arsenosugar biosynthesis glycosyltransferase [Acidobacteria bacterium]|nr:TIGR04283 family arsenosugar biosynthesis glycosyltransferase [Acidobacteriota bacterium]